MEHLVRIGIRCQQTKSVVLSINDAEDLEFILGIESGGQEVLDALIATGLIEPECGEYTCKFFEEQNKQLLSNWKNGERLSLRSKEKNSTQSNSIQSNSNQLNPSQFNSTQRYA